MKPSRRSFTNETIQKIFYKKLGTFSLFLNFADISVIEIFAKFILRRIRVFPDLYFPVQEQNRRLSLYRIISVKDTACPYSELFSRIRTEYPPYLFVYGPEYLRIRTLFTQCDQILLVKIMSNAFKLPQVEVFFTGRNFLNLILFVILSIVLCLILK